MARFNVTSLSEFTMYNYNYRLHLKGLSGHVMSETTHAYLKDGDDAGSNINAQSILIDKTLDAIECQ